MVCRKVATTYNLLRNRGKDKYKANKLMASNIKTLEQHLDYEAIVQIAEIDDQDLLYLNFDNQVLGETHHTLLVFFFFCSMSKGQNRHSAVLWIHTL